MTPKRAHSTLQQVVTVTPKKRAVPTDDVHCRNIVLSPSSKRTRMADIDLNTLSSQAARTEQETRSSLTTAANKMNQAQRDMAGEVDTKKNARATTTRIDKASRLPQEEVLMREQKRKEELQAYRDKYRKAFPSFVFYLDGFDEATKRELVQRVEALGGRVDPFFSRSCNHLVTSLPVEERYINPSGKGGDASGKLRVKENVGSNASATQPLGLNLNLTNVEKKPTDTPEKATDIMLSKARVWGMRIWPKYKFLQILRTLEDKTLEVVTPRKDLSHMLQQEKLHGTFERDVMAERSGYHYFTRGTLYLLVEDATGVHRPIAIEEHRRPGPDEQPPWPVLYNEGEGRCPFTKYEFGSRRRVAPTANAHQSLRRSLSLSQVRAATQDGRLAPVESHLEYPLASGNSVQITSNVGSTTSANFDALAAVGKAGLDPRIAQLTRKTLDTTMVKATGRAPSAPAQETKAIPVKEPKVAPLRRFLAMRASNRENSAAPCGIRRSVSASDASRFKQAKNERKPGYCENCRVKYDDFEEHIASRKHIKFAENDDVFWCIDELIRRVQRKRIVKS